ncbi:cysteine proteinase inhibitor 5-like [Cucumis melo var. makuwa]|uniref:Cysteine proteinase inhibitor 5-like n=1 Tax=Cucumis melo var. makuwa TaxID=1194695 RepID=A0A5A7SHR8_CUCMM|nr:cysteine proteinase inhibitor 5-like [Cucumis melo var. makuwa]KAA0036719.1 cysteine proteinase inhibitor 5-like [Cucumis melo var. makuwa]
MCSPVVVQYIPCSHPDDEQLHEIAEWAVKKYNEQGHHLTLLRILDCEKQVVVAGINWRLLLKCRDENNGENHYYETVVYDKPREHLRELIYFHRLYPHE